MTAAWNADLTVTEAVDAADGVPARIVASIADPMQIIETAPFAAASIEVTVTMADGAPLPAQVGQTLLARLRVT